MARGLEVLLFGCALVCSGCFDDIATKFEPGIAALEVNEAASPSDVGVLTVASGEEPTYLWVHGRGLIDASPDVVWAVAKEPERLINYCQSDTQNVQTNVETEYEFSFKVSYVVETAFADIGWDELWRYGPTPGGHYQIIRYQKTFGSDAIELLEGAIQVRPTNDPGRTEVQFVEHLDSIGGGIEEMTKQMQQRFDELTTGVAGAPHPLCRD